MREVKILSIFLVMVFGVLLQAAQTDPCRIYLNKSVRCGIFTTWSGHWSLSEQADVRLSYDQKGILLEAELRVPEGKKFILRGKKDDDLGLFGGSVFEFQLAPPAQKGVYYHFGLSPSSYMYSARKKDIRWNGKGVKFTSKCVPDKFWRFTLNVPWSALEEKMPRKGDVWRMHMGKSVPTKFDAVEYSSISGARNYHDVDQYAFLTFGEDTPQNRSLLLSHIVHKGKNLIFNFLSVNKVIPGVLHYTLDGGIHGGKVPVVKGNKKGLWKGSFSFLAPVGDIPLKGNIAFDVRVEDHSSGTLLCGKGQLPVREMAKVVLDRFYYTKEHDSIQYSHTFHGKTSVVVKKAGLIIHTLRNAPSKGSLSLAELKLVPGRYILEMTDGNHSIQQLFFVLDKTPVLPPLKSGAPLKIRSDRTFSLGGEPFYLLGLSPAKVTVPYQSVFNLHYNTAGVRENAVSMKFIPTGARLVRRPFTGRIYGDESRYLKRVADYAAKLSDSRKAVFHLLSYEAQIPAVVQDSKGRTVKGSTADLMKRAYRAAKSIAPESLFSIHVDNEKFIPYYAESCDIFQSACYGKDTIVRLTGALERLHSLVHSKALIMWLGGTIPHHRHRIAEEIRCGVYLSIVKGMAGNIIHMGHDPMPRSRTRMWSLLAGLPGEIEGFYKDFAAGKDVPFTLKDKNLVSRMRVLPNGEKILIVVNTSAVPVSMTLDGGIAGSIRIYGAGEVLGKTEEKNASFWRTLFGKNFVYRDTLCGYEPKVYYLKK